MVELARLCYSKMKILITGVKGFVGNHLANLLKEEDEVYGIDKNNIDITDGFKLKEFIGKLKPEEIFHLVAAGTSPLEKTSFEEMYKVNVIGTINLLEGILSANIDPVILLVGSSAEYGYSEIEENPLTESQPLRPLNNYGITKVIQGLIGYQYFKTRNLRVIRTRTFNHTGPGEREGLVCSAFARQLVQIEKGMRKPIIEVGNLKTQRDFTDVRDIVKAYKLLISKGTPGEIYNVCSGKPYYIREILNTLIALARVDVKIRKVPERTTFSDVPLQFGNNGKLKRLTGWEAQIPIKKSLEDLLNYWRNQV